MMEFCNLEQSVGLEIDLSCVSKLLVLSGTTLCYSIELMFETPVGIIVLYVVNCYSQIRIMVPQFCSSKFELISGFNRYPTVIYKESSMRWDCQIS